MWSDYICMTSDATRPLPELAESRPRCQIAVVTLSNTHAAVGIDRVLKSDMRMESRDRPTPLSNTRQMSPWLSSIKASKHNA